MNRRLVAGLLCALLLLGAVSGALAENLKIGAEGKQVRLAQARLKQLGFYRGDVDSKFGYSTYLAVRAFQGMNGLKVDGVIGVVTTSRLFANTVVNSKGVTVTSQLAIRVAYGDSGPAVKMVQDRLRALRFYSGTADSKFGYATFLAVKEFQKWNRLTVDGIVGPTTWRALFSSSASPYEPDTTPNLPDPSAGTYFRITYGMRGNLVRQIQTRLHQLKYSPGKIDGVYGYATVRAVREFQRVNFLKPDGVVGRNTWDTLFGPNPLPKPATVTPAVELRIAYGSSGILVQQIQTRLGQLGYYTIDVDGKFGYATFTAVKIFQKRNALKVDGVVGQLTWDKLMSPTAVPK